MTVSERADWERRELLRQARLEAFAQRQIEANREARERAEALLASKRRQSRQLVLEYMI